MSKAKVAVAFGETPATSSKINNLITDYLSRGQLVLSAVGGAWATTVWLGAVQGFQGQVRNPLYLGWYPYNPAKQVFDRIGLYGYFAAVDSDGDQITGNYDLQYSLNTGSSWVDADLTQVSPPFSIAGAQTWSGIAPVSGGQLIDVSSVAAFQWLGFRLNNGGGEGAGILTWNVFAFLYLSTDTPF